MEIFYRNLEFINSHNKFIRSNPNFSKDDLILGINEFAAISNNEFKEKFTFNPINQEQSYFQFEKTKKIEYQNEYGDIPDYVDWVEKGAVTSVYSQGTCNGSWAFSVVGTMEGVNQLETGNLQFLSTQQLISCNNENLGCEGGNILRGFSYVKQYGLQTFDDYPYTSGQGVTGECKYNQEQVNFNLKDYYLSNQFNPQALEFHSSQSPLSVGIDGSSLLWQFYKSGVIDDVDCGENLNHAVTLVGYNNKNDVPYWKIKNSLGTQWGQRGFGFIKKTSEIGPGICGINKFGVYPDLN